MNNNSKKTLSKKRTKKAKKKSLTPEQKALQAEQAAKKAQIIENRRSITAHAINLFQQYTALRKKGLDSSTATLQAYADYEKVHGHKFLSSISMWTKIKTEAGIRIYDLERQESRKSLNLAKIPTRLEAKRSVLTQNQKKVHNQNANTLRLIGGKKLPVTSMGLIVCPVCEIHIKDSAIEWHLRHNHVDHVDNPFTNPIVAPIDTLEETVEIRDLLIGDKTLPIKSSTINMGSYKKDKRYFNKQVYQTALLTMTQSEAWKLATDEESSMTFLSNQYISPLTSPEPNNEISLIMDGTDIAINESLTNPFKAANDTCATGRTVEVTHKVRHAGDQADFKRRVWDNFNGRCAITGYPLPEGILEAAHIEAITESANNNTSNGLLLEVSLHRMFDKGLMGINPEDLTIHFSINCIHKTMFEGKTLQPHHVELDAGKLMTKWKKFHDKR
ncbi:HNH endonuclease [Escherichia coli]|nr:HNH endonuclease [Escherichia coli]